MKNLAGLLISAAVAVWLSPTSWAEAARAADPTPSSHVESVADQALQIATRPEASGSARDIRLDQLLSDGFAIGIMAEHVIGDVWQQASSAQRNEFRQAFKRYLMNDLVEILQEHEPDDFTVIDTKTIDSRDTRVTTSVEKFGLGFGEVDWVVREVGRSYRIVDVIIDGISMLRTYRDEFGQYAARHGIDVLTMALNTKVQPRR